MVLSLADHHACFRSHGPVITPCSSTSDNSPWSSRESSWQTTVADLEIPWKAFWRTAQTSIWNHGMKLRNRRRQDMLRYGKHTRGIRFLAAVLIYTARRREVYTGTSNHVLTPASTNGNIRIVEPIKSDPRRQHRQLWLTICFLIVPSSAIDSKFTDGTSLVRRQECAITRPFPDVSESLSLLRTCRAQFTRQVRSQHIFLR